VFIRSGPHPGVSGNVTTVDVSLTDEQQQWQEVTARLATSFAVDDTSALDRPEEPQNWASVVELGIPALRSPEHCGVESAGVESMLAVEQAARRLCLLPLVGQGVVTPELLVAAGAAGLLDAVVGGDARVAPALTADLSGLGHVGQPAVAFDAAGATHALLLDGDRLAAVELPGPTLEGLDLTRRCTAVDATAVPVDLDVGGPIGPARLERATAVALTAFASDLLGVMDGALADAVAYAGDRAQFGTAIGSFQAVQHLLADAAVRVEGARSCVWHAAWAIDHLEPAAATEAARTAKAYCSAAGIQVVETSVQVFGGIAITWEHLSHVRLRRAHLDRVCLGDERVHHRAISRARIAGAAS
jgi:alkylation response protein AidB-like acyl-CoA dehydrogenase